jgi:hypothetical protein
MRGYFRSQWVVSRLPAELRQPTGQLFHFGGGRDEAASCVCAAPSTKDAPGSVSMAGEKTKAASHLVLAAEANPIRGLVV